MKYKYTFIKQDELFLKEGYNQFIISNDLIHLKNRIKGSHGLDYYKNDENSFGAKLVKAANFKFNRRIGDSENFIIHYNSYHAGLCHLTNYDEFNYGAFGTINPGTDSSKTKKTDYTTTDISNCILSAVKESDKTISSFFKNL